MEKVAAGARPALNCRGGGIRIDGSSQGSAIITTGEDSWLVCGVAGSAEDLPGPGTVFLSVEWRFVKAVGVGDEISARVTVTHVRADKPICTLATEIVNGAGEVCLTGTATTYTVPLRDADHET